MNEWAAQQAAMQADQQTDQQDDWTHESRMRSSMVEPRRFGARIRDAVARSAYRTGTTAATALCATLAIGVSIGLPVGVSAQTAKPAEPAPVTAAPEATAKPPVLAIPDAPKPKTAKAWLVMDDATGKVLAGENIDMRLEPASITKAMTSYVIGAELKAGRIKASDPVTMSVNAWTKGGAGTDGSYSGFEVNKTAPLEQMEIGMAVQSGNDAAIALAEHTAGSETAFADLMNEYGKRIGLKNTRFVNATGLSAEGHYSTAHDLALIGSALIRDFPQQYAYNKIKEFKVGAMNPQLNRNRLLWRDESVDGIKTGHHSGAGFCLLSSAKRGDQRLIAVVMNTAGEEERAVDSLALLNWAFRFYETHRLYQANTAVATHKIWKGQADQVKLGLQQPLLVSTPRGRYGELKPQMDVPKTLVAPIKAGQAIGKVRVMLDGKTVIEAPLVALEAIPEAGFFKRLWHEFLMWWESE
jgi:serine-type D-Ala-D-Ala carboxypeptidase (penicillin-binding protein 5/6)